MIPAGVTDRRFAARLRAIRRARDLSARRLAELAGVGEHVVQRIEAAGRGVGPRTATLGEAVTLAAALGVPLAAMVAADEVRIPIPAGAE